MKEKIGVWDCLTSSDVRTNDPSGLAVCLLTCPLEVGLLSIFHLSLPLERKAARLVIRPRKVPLNRK